MEKPLISIVTVSYNASTTIEQTILSVINQTYPNIEYIIIDGGSTDGTVDIIKKYTDKIAYWVSEPDKGIYDAMNKGIAVATGEWINFMNSGDSFYRNDVLYALFRQEVKGDVLCGSTHVIEKWGAFLERPLALEYMKERKPFCHQSTLVRLKWMKRYLFDIKYSICADYAFFYKLWQENVPFVYVSIVISNFDRSIDSFSGNSPMGVIIENLLISSTRGWKQWLVLSRKLIRFWIGKLFALILPYKAIVKRRRRLTAKSSRVISCDWINKPA